MKFFPKLSEIIILFCFVSGSVNAQTDNWEFRMLQNIADNRTEGKTKFYKTISQSNIVAGIAVPATYFAIGLAEKNTSLKNKALYMVESMALAQGSTFLLKRIIERERPVTKYQALMPVINPSGYAFPSGHTSGAFSMATSFTIACPKWYVAVPSFTYAALVGYSRIYLGVHYPSDVFAGALLGAGSAWAMYKLNKWIHKSKEVKLKKLPLL
jgi:membrane-associated phospholipid phosphatase